MEQHKGVAVDKKSDRCLCADYAKKMHLDDAFICACMNNWI